MTLIDDVLSAGAVRSVFQPIIELDTGRVVAYEALARGPAGSLHTPDALFGAARAAGRLGELDQACRRAAFEGAVQQRLLAPLTVFVNVEPEVLDRAPLRDLLRIAEAAPGELRVVMEITERALAARPAELLYTVERVRDLGWGVALDDVGAESASLAFMPLLRPDVVKLDLRLVQHRPGPAVAEIMNAVNAYAERSGARVLAEGIETDTHLMFARALGATLGQGWLFGRPGPGAVATHEVGELTLPSPRLAPVVGSQLTPFDCLPDTVVLRRSPKSLLIELSKHLEREAMRLGETCLVGAAFQEARHFTPSTAARFRDLVERTGFVCGLGEGLPSEPIPGLRGATLSVADPLRGEWDVVVLSPHYSAALLARDLHGGGPDMDRMFEYALTYERETVVLAAHGLLSRVAPRPPRLDEAPLAPTAPLPRTSGSTTSVTGGGALEGERLLGHAMAGASSGVTIVDMRLPDQPLVYVNAAFVALSGLPAEEVLGRNCRFLQGADTDRAAVGRMRAAVEAGIAFHETVLNHRGPDRTPWWNEIRLTPVTDDGGSVVQYIGVQSDVTDQVEAQREAARRATGQGHSPPRSNQIARTTASAREPDRYGAEDRVGAGL